MKRKGSQNSFTLIELLIVVIVIGILAGIVFKLMNSANKQQQIAVCYERLQRLAHALEEYKSEYGQYPPVSSIEYMYESPSSNTMCSYLRYDYFKKNDGGSKLFRYGLVSFLVPRARPGFEHTVWTDKDGVSHDNSAYDPDSSRDEIAKSHWATFMNDPYPLVGGGSEEQSAAGLIFTNALETIKDPWGATVHYSSVPPYLTYELWSSGSGKNIFYGMKLE